jgi:uncharacterized protein YggU (UPF0235/DUF167 family)
MPLIIDIKVIPQSGKQLFKFDKNDRIVCYIKNSPERGLANREVLQLIARLCKIPQSHVTLIAGSTSRAKRIKIDIDVTLATLYECLGLVKQLQIFSK